MAILHCGGWTDSALKNALASFGLTLLLFLAPVSPSTAQVERVDKPHRRVVRTSEPDYPNIGAHKLPRRPDARYCVQLYSGGPV